MSKDFISVRVTKTTHQTNHFNKNQKVWLQYMSGDMAAKVIGKYRAKGRYVSAWIKWNGTTKPEPDFKSVEVPGSFAKEHGLLIYSPKT